MYCLPYLWLLTFVFQPVLGWKYFKGIIVADDENFEDLIHAKGKFTLVNFYSKTCGHCSKLGPNYEPLSELFNNTRVQIAQLEGRENKRIRKRENLIGFPILRLYSFDGTHIASFNEERTTENLARFITDHTGVQPKWPESRVVTNFKSSEDVESLLKQSLYDGRDVVIAFAAPWLEFWTSRYSPYERLARKNPDKLFISIDSTSEATADILSKYKVSKFPTVIYYDSNTTSDGSFSRLDSLENPNDDIEIKHVEAMFSGGLGKKYNSVEDLAKQVDEVEEKLYAHKRKGFNKDSSANVSPEEEAEKFRRLREL